MRSLYIAHAGMTEPLGRAQILPYLFGLAARGADIEVLSFEPEETSNASIEETRALLASKGLGWRPQVRSKRHDMATKFFESGKGVLMGLSRALLRRPHIIHARSYLPAAVADVIATSMPRAKLLFDCRGMIGDEYVDGGRWTQDRLEYRMVKRVEHRLFHRAEGMVVLTEALAKWLRDGQHLGPNVNLAVIPCCVDLERFGADAEVRLRGRASLGLEPDELAVLYSGSLGHWYLEAEMARFTQQVKHKHPRTRFVLLSRSDTSSLREAFKRVGLTDADLIVRSVKPDAMPATLPAGDIGLSFIQPCFSKMGSSPTKVAEYLAAGMPTVVNGTIGDQRDLARDGQACSVVDDFSDAALEEAAANAVATAKLPFAVRSALTRSAAETHFSLSSIGVPRYVALYEALASDLRIKG